MPSWLESPWLDYSITRPITLRYFNATFLLIGVIYVICSTVISVVGSGYESLPVILVGNSFNVSNPLWYDHFLPNALTRIYGLGDPGCSATTITINEDLDTTTRYMSGYSLLSFTDPGSNSQVGMAYSNNAFRNCSVQWIGLTQSLYVPAQSQAITCCNTTAEQYFCVQNNGNTGDPLSLNSAFSGSLPSGPLNINSVIEEWAFITLGLLVAIAPSTTKSVFHLSLQQYGLSSLQLSYADLDNQSMPNTPANDHWQLQLASTSINALEPNSTYITFLPNGSIDMTRTSQTDLDNANSLLAPAIFLLQAGLNQPFNFWELINWMLVSFYWLFLADLGQISPTILGAQATYIPTSNIFINQSTFLPTNNIFINQSLFEIYSSYLRNTIIPLLGPVTEDYPPLPPFNNLSTENSLREQDSTFTLSYSCVRRTIKPALSFIVSVIVADYALIMGAYTLVITVAGGIQKRKRRDGNHCKGCLEFENDGVEVMPEAIPLRRHTYSS